MRTELERREEYMKQIKQKYDFQGRPSHPVIFLIQSCLQNSPSKRPNIEEVLEKATKLKESNLEEDMTLNKIQFYQRVQVRLYFEYALCNARYNVCLAL